ncbi:olfactory receptor 5AR1-like [Pelobates fuscus]|uniref:olfactory receptor 5AR1-like n=1 Tax=Pelobates fuscus TaxID=191477 RepID=UPI002FE43625
MDEYAAAHNDMADQVLEQKVQEMEMKLMDVEDMTRQNNLRLRAVHEMVLPPDLLVYVRGLLHAYAPEIPADMLLVDRTWRLNIMSENESTLNEFTVKGFSDSPQLQFPLFITFLSVYLIIIFSNLIVVLSIILYSDLHTPMYILLCNLSVIDISYTSTILPKLLAMLHTQCKTISFLECFIQLYFFLSFICVEIFLLAAMAYDRYIAICHPLHYSILMSPKHCARLVLTVWVMGLFDPVVHIFLFANLSYCHSHHIDHFFCDVTSLIKLTCSDTFTIEIWNYVDGTLSVSAFILTLISYVFIISTILNIQSASGRHKAFSTCSSHITCVIIFYGTLICLYMKPTSMYSPGQDKFFSILYIILIPILNPLLYTLKNKDFKDVFNRLIKKMFCSELYIKVVL